MLDMLRPCHFADVNEAFDTLFEFDERTVVGHRDDLSCNALTYVITLLYVCPRVRRKLLHSEGDALLVVVVIEHYDGDYLIELDNFVRMRNPAPRKIGDMHESIDS